MFYIFLYNAIFVMKISSSQRFLMLNYVLYIIMEFLYYHFFNIFYHYYISMFMYSCNGLFSIFSTRVEPKIDQWNGPPAASADGRGGRSMLYYNCRIQCYDK